MYLFLYSEEEKEDLLWCAFYGKLVWATDRTINVQLSFPSIPPRNVF